MGITAMTIEFPADENVVVLTGPRGAGKTSIIKALFSALRGKNYRPDKPIKDGEERADITLDLGDIKVSQLSDPERRDFRITTIGFVFQDFELLDVNLTYHRVHSPPPALRYSGGRLTMASIPELRPRKPKGSKLSCRLPLLKPPDC